MNRFEILSAISSSTAYTNWLFQHFPHDAMLELAPGAFSFTLAGSLPLLKYVKAGLELRWDETVFQQKYQMSEADFETVCSGRSRKNWNHAKLAQDRESIEPLLSLYQEVCWLSFRNASIALIKVDIHALYRHGCECKKRLRIFRRLTLPQNAWRRDFDVLRLVLQREADTARQHYGL